MKFLVCIFLLFVTSVNGEIYITVTGANVKKAKLALGRLHPLPNSPQGNPSVPRDLSAQLRWDLEFTNLFDFIPESLFAELDRPEDRYATQYAEWSQKGASFVLKAGYKVESGKLILEALLHDIAGQKKIFGTRYQYNIAQFSRVVHAMAEDVLKSLTGERGLFFSRILMVCRASPHRSRFPTKEVYIVDPDGKNFSQLTFDGTLSLSPSWAPDGNNISYTQYGSIGPSKKQGVVLKKHNLLTGNRNVLSARDGMNSGAAWNPKGNQIALTLSFNGRPEIYLINPHLRGEAELLSRLIQVRRISGDGFQPSYGSLLFDVEPSWSPDGSKLVFSSARSGHPMIYIVDVASKIASQLTFAGQYNSSPDWSPKGDRIIFAAQRIKEGHFDLYAIDPDGNNLARITAGDRINGRRKANTENPSWAPTGRHIVYSNNETGRYAIYAMTLDGSVKKRISPENRECTEPSWGPPSIDD